MQARTGGNRTPLYACGLIVFVYALCSVILPACFGLTLFGEAVQCTLLLACYLSTLPNQMRGDRATRRFWTLMSAGFGLWLLLQALWTFYEVVLKKDVPELFWGDAVLFLHVVPMLLAFVSRPHTRSEASRREVVDAILMTVWTLYVYATFVISWQYVVVDVGAYNRNFNLVDWAANGLVLLAAGICWFSSRGRWSRFFFHWCGAIALNALGSCLADIAIDRGVYYTGSVYDLPIIASMAWFALIGFYCATDKQAMMTEPASAVKGSLISRGTGVGIAAAALLGGWSIAQGAVPDEVVRFRVYTLFAAAGVSAFLLIFRMAMPRPQLGPAAARHV
jgi:hypothetical protein